MSEGLDKEKLIPYCPCIGCESEREDKISWHGGWLSLASWTASFICRVTIGCLKEGDSWSNPNFIETAKKEYEKRNKIQ